MAHLLRDPLDREAELLVFEHRVRHQRLAAILRGRELHLGVGDDVRLIRVVFVAHGDAADVADGGFQEADAFDGLGYEAGFGDLVACGGNLRVCQQVMAGGACFGGDMFHGLLDDRDEHVQVRA